MIEPVEQPGDVGVQELHALALVFLPRDEWAEMGENALYSRTDPYYPHFTEMPPDFEDEERPKVPHTWMGRAAVILPSGVFEGCMEGQPPAIPPWREELQRAVPYLGLPGGTTCFAIITAEGQWIECYEAEASVLLRCDGDELVPVNPVRPLTRMQVKWRHFVACHARERPDEVVVPCDAYMRLTNTIDLARGTESRDIDAIGS